MSYLGESPVVRYRMVWDGVAHRWTPRVWYEFFGATTLNNNLTGTVNWGQQNVVPQAGSTNNTSGLFRGPFVVEEFFVRNRLSAAGVDTEWFWLLNGVRQAGSVVLAAGVREGSVLPAVTVPAGARQRISVEFDADPSEAVVRNWWAVLRLSEVL